jgi:hypothetical protein
MSSLRLLARLFLILQNLCFSAGAMNAAVEKICHVHVFVHGTYAPVFTLLSYPSVRNDDLKGTSYLGLQRLIRDSQFARYHRFSSGAGLSEVSPHTNVADNDPARYVVGAFSAVQREMVPNSRNRYFMFGWSGLLSQKERRREAIRLYNELVSLVESMTAAGVTPVLNIYGHSHGSNVILNLGLVHGCTFAPELLPAQTEVDVIEDMNKLLAGGAVDDLADFIQQDAFELSKHLYEKPTQPLGKIKQIALFGLPVQPETAPLVLSSLFESVLQIYSDNDSVPYTDLISSKKQSQLRLNPTLIAGHSSVKMVRWMNERTPLDECAQCLEEKIPRPPSRFGRLSKISLENIGRLNEGSSPDSHHPLDPWHADFWAIGKKREGAFFEQVPLLVYTPLLNKLLSSAGVEQQLDFCLLGREDRAKGVLFINDGKQQPVLCDHASVSLKPIQWARAGIVKILNVSKKLKFNFKINSPFFKKK